MDNPLVDVEIIENIIRDVNMSWTNPFRSKCGFTSPPKSTHFFLYFYKNVQQIEKL